MLFGEYATIPFSFEIATRSGCEVLCRKVIQLTAAHFCVKG